MKTKRFILFFATTFLPLFLVFSLATGASAADTGESLFRKNCSSCHPDGGNILNSKKTLRKADREENGILTEGDIVQKMRNPGLVSTHPQDFAGMKMFNKDKISDFDAQLIARYIMQTFK